MSKLNMDKNSLDIRLVTWVVMDGTIVDYKKYNPNSIKIRIQFKLSKERKINRLRDLLEQMNIKYTFKLATKSGVNKLQPYYIRIYGDDARMINDLLDGEKQLPNCFRFMMREYFDVFLEELTHTDGFKNYQKILWNTTSEHDATLVKNLCLTHDIPVKIRIKEHASGFKHNCKTQYHLTIY